MSKKVFHGKKNYLLLSSIFAFILFSGLVSALNVKVDDYKGTYNIGTTFDVQIYIDGYVTDMTGFQLDFYWNKNILNCTSAISYPQNFWSVPFLVGEGLDSGHYFVAYGGLNGKYTGSGKTIAILKFKVVNVGTSPLDLRNVMLLSSEDHTVSVIKAGVVDGTFDNSVTPASNAPLSLFKELIRMITNLFE